MADSQVLDVKSMVAAPFETALDTFAGAVILTDVNLRIAGRSKCAATT
ncbi:hypothetical protein QA641_04505 [Bradyrhizobium sp. CB1650]|nr:hypothetical protein [Bradyrhizobium sp. CB1650]WGD53197.1 hypothetical protein QA641_04505 [Bradyrhizobium sp. CB1650]